MTQTPSEFAELHRAIERFEAASRRRRLTAAEPVRSRQQRVHRHRLPLAAFASVLLVSLAVGWVIVLERAESPAVEVSARAEPDDQVSTVRRQQAGYGQEVSADQTASDRSRLRTDPEPLRSVNTELSVDLLATREPSWLGPHPPGEAEQSRVRLTSTPTALPAGDAVLLGPPWLSTLVLRGEHSDGDQVATDVAEETESSALGVPRPRVPYRGVMTDSVGAPLAGVVSAIFALYENPAGGVPLWVDIKTVQVDAGGMYAVELGGTTELSVELCATGEPRWLGVQPTGQDEQPRVRFTCVPDALKARGADLRDTRLPSGFVLPGGEHGEGDLAATWSVEETTSAAPNVPPLLIPYRGVMTDSAGAPLVGRLIAIFALYEEPSGGVPLWVDIKSVRAGSDGGYTVVLGETTEFPVDLFVAGAPRWLGVQPTGEDEQPRVRFTRAPYALQARGVDLRDRRPSECVLPSGEHRHGNLALGQDESCDRTVTMALSR